MANSGVSRVAARRNGVVNSLRCLWADRRSSERRCHCSRRRCLWRCRHCCIRKAMWRSSERRCRWRSSERHSGVYYHRCSRTGTLCHEHLPRICQIGGPLVTHMMPKHLFKTMRFKSQQDAKTSTNPGSGSRVRKMVLSVLQLGGRTITLMAKQPSASR